MSKYLHGPAVWRVKRPDESPQEVPWAERQDEFMRCTRGKPLLMIIPPEGITIPCDIHPEGHFVYGPPRVIC